MPRTRFEPTTPAFERTKTDHALDSSATVIGLTKHINLSLIIRYCKTIKYVITIDISHSSLKYMHVIIAIKK
jgi:hypothetical protein